MVRRSRPPLYKLAVAFVAVWGLGMGCNPSFIDAIGGSPVASANTPDGYIVILLMNKTSTAITAQVDIVKEDGSTHRETLSVAPLLFFAFATDCNITSIQVVSFSYASTGGVIDVPSNLGVVPIGNGINCGNVMSIIASGSPPTFNVQVY